MPEITIDPATLARLEKMIGPDVVREIKGMFQELTPKRLGIVQESTRAGELEAAFKALHDLKSSAGMLGAFELQRLADRMEQLARKGEEATLGSLMPELERRCAEAMEGLSPEEPA